MSLSAADDLFGKAVIEMTSLEDLLDELYYPAPLGSFGSLCFEVSRLKVLTFDRYRRESKARYGRHELVNQTPVLEYLGADTEKISFTMKFTTALNVNPSEECDKVRRMCMTGEANYLILGDKVTGDNLWVITSVSESALAWDGNGEIIVSEVNVEMEEYVAAVNE